jgi:hypothetical protein
MNGLSARPTSSTQSQGRRRKLDAYNERMDESVIRRDEYNFSNYGISSDAHRRKGIDERTDTLYIRNGVLLRLKWRTNLSVPFRYCGSGIPSSKNNSCIGWLKNIPHVTTKTDKLITSDLY